MTGSANLPDLIAYVAEECHITKKLSKEITLAVLQGIVQLTKDNQRLTLREFGRFETKYRKQRINRKPIQGDPSIIPARELLTFTSSPLLTEEAHY